MSEESGGAGIIVKWILIITVLLIVGWALYTFLLKPVFGVFGGEPPVPPAAPGALVIPLMKSFKNSQGLES
ncbi:MAG TPA: hypothetical protein HA282_05585 [Nanoarchaeota archaeon]|nr:MAG: hypothetical protein QT01_C0001G0111 [archaeon GW2011_AR6]MBS3082557.1 hypothetical protein [Candidatus Pacearchaeota archaeon]HIH17482.1 hypothetical protein [Nanoarchaeota archaeon]HIH33935.1 hypothetical protein [Nanoarchaeota archaeon]HIH51774.1 hypothetical protein [Nanoarchaeota archaeon]